jgi:hypothetical protein
MSRTEENIEPAEAAATVAICKLAEACEALAYLHDFQGTPTATKKAVLKAYRVLKSVVEYHMGENSPLIWSAPDYRFTKK